MKKIYIMGSLSHIGRYKIGISKNVTNRRKNISESIKSDVFVIFSCPLLFAYFWEQLLHVVYSPLNASMKGSGKTEWFWMFAPITPILFILTFFCLELGVITWAVLWLNDINQNPIEFLRSVSAPQQKPPHQVQLYRH